MAISIGNSHLNEATRFSHLFIESWREGNGLVLFMLRKDHFLH